MATTATTARKERVPHGWTPPSGKVTASASAGRNAPAAIHSPSVRWRWVSHSAPPASARKSPATGLAQVVRTAHATAERGRPRWRASSAPSANATPKPKVSRPMKRSVAVAAANHTIPQRARWPKCRPASSANSAAETTAAIAPTTRGPTSAARGGNSSE
jgi:hypothetical protein